MSVDERRETFHVNRIAPSDLDERLLAQAYRPDVVGAVRTLISKGAKPLSSALDGRLTQGRTPEYGEDGEICLKTRNVVGGLVDGSSVDRVSSRFARENGANRISNETVLMNRSGAGSVGRVSVYFGAEGVFTNEELFRFRIAAPHDPAFVTVFFGTSLGERVLERGVNGSTGQLKLVQEHVESVPVLFPHPDAQRYIGDKVRQAERLRERARGLEAAVRREYRAEIARLGYVEVPHRKSFRTRLRDRLDPAYYDPAFTSVLDAPWLTSNSEPLSRFFSDGSYGDLPDSGTYGTGGKWLLRATDLDRCMTHWDAGIRVPAAEVGAKSEVKENDILLEVKGAIEKCAIGRGPAVGKHVNGTVFRLSPSGINAGYLCLHLTAEIKRKYAAREAVNNIIQYLNLDCIRALPVLRLDDDLEGRLGGSFIEAVDARSATTTLTSAATTLVEHLIDGRLTEADLVAAQKALEAGDCSADREILKGLRQSDTPDAKPLIADVDALYALLDESEGQDA